MLTKASAVTLARIAMVPAFMVFLLSDHFPTTTVALVVFVIAAGTDWLDGHLARKYNEITDFGKFIDPLADKLLVTSAMLIFVGQGRLASWAAMLIIAREFVITSLRLVAMTRGKVLAAGWSGKIKTFIQIGAVVSFLYFDDPTHLFYFFGHSMTSDTVAGFAMVAVAIWSGADYLVRHRSVLKPDEVIKEEQA